MTSYDDWKTTPPDDESFCPLCLANAEDDWEDSEGRHCVHCGQVYDEPIGRAAAREIAKWDAADAAYEARVGA